MDYIANVASSEIDVEQIRTVLVQGDSTYPHIQFVLDASLSGLSWRVRGFYRDFNIAVLSDEIAPTETENEVTVDWYVSTDFTNYYGEMQLVLVGTDALGATVVKALGNVIVGRDFSISTTQVITENLFEQLMAQLSSSALKLDQTTPQTITGGVPLLASGRVIDEDHQIVDKAYVDGSHPDHNDLSGLQGGEVGEYYHVTAAEKTVIENTSGTNTGDQDLSGFLKLDQTSPQEITNGIPTLATTRVIDSVNQLVDKKYVDQYALGGPGFNANLYFTTINSDVIGYRKLSYTAEATQTELSVAATTVEQLVRTYLFDSGLGVSVIDGGKWSATYRARVSASQGAMLRFEAFLRHADNSETTLFSQSSDKIVNTAYATLETQVTQPSFNCVSTDRLGVRLYASTTHPAGVTLYTIAGDGNASYINTPLAIRHAQLRDKNGEADVQHMTAAQIAALHSHANKTALDAVRGTNTGDQDVSGAISAHNADAAAHSDILRDAIYKDFTSYISDNTAYTRMRIKKTDLSSTLGSGVYSIDVVLDNGANHITYQWRRDLHDDFAKLQNVFYGTFLSAWLANFLPTLTGSFSTGSVASYTTTVGNHFDATVYGDEIRFNYYSDNRGGVWSFVIDGGTPVLVSTWSTSVVGVNTAIVATGLTNTPHTVVATFMGADPSHAPTGGTARGWLRYSVTATSNTDFALNGYQQNNVETINLMGAGSNSEFAIAGTKSGETVYFPEHNSVGTCFEVTSPVITVDNSIIDFGALANGQYLSCSYAKITESVYFHFPVGNVDVARLDINYDVGIDGVLCVSGKITVLDSFVASGYHAMLPIGTSLNTIVTGRGNSQLCTYDDSYRYFADEKDLTSSFCGVSTTNKDYIFAMSIDHLYHSLRVGKTGRKRLDQFTFVWQRSVQNGAPKLYLQPYDSASLVSGDIIEFYTRYAAGAISGVYDTLL